MASTRQTSTKTSRSPHTQHRDKDRCASHKRQILDALMGAHPHAPSLDDLLVITTRLSARVEELRVDGWSIETERIEGRPSTYRLVSKTKGQPVVISAAVTIHVSPQTGGVARTHERLSGAYSADRLAYAEEQAKRAYVRALGWTPPPKVNVVSDDLDLFTDGGW